jgi:hypothetical protein
MHRNATAVYMDFVTYYTIEPNRNNNCVADYARVCDWLDLSCHNVSVGAACRLQRRIIDENPRVTRFQNRFDGPEDEDDEPPVDEADLAEAEDDLVIHATGAGAEDDMDMQDQENDDLNGAEDDGEEGEEDDDEDGGKLDS